MELAEVRISQSPMDAHRVRLTGTVLYDDGAVRPEEYWFDVPEQYADSLSETGNPWLVCLVPLAVSLGEPLRIGKPVDSVLLGNIHKLMGIWRCWYPSLDPVQIEAQTFECRSGRGERTAAFFSGGVDSFFTVLRHSSGNGSSSSVQIQDLLTVWGLDIPLRKADAFHRMRDLLRSASEKCGMSLIDVSTNIRETRWKQTDWGHLSHNCALAGVALALEKRCKRALIASSYGYGDLHPWGSHPLTDPLLSSSLTQIVHDGAAYNRVQKTEYVTNNETALGSLRVCWQDRSDKNCCKCSKCYRTMITLSLIGMLEKCTSFDAQAYNVKRIR